MKATIIKHIPGTSRFDVFIISGNKCLKLISYASKEIQDAIENGIINEVPTEKIIEEYSPLKMVELLNNSIASKYYQL